MINARTDTAGNVLQLSSESMPPMSGTVVYLDVSLPYTPAYILDDTARCLYTLVGGSVTPQAATRCLTNSYMPAVYDAFRDVLYKQAFAIQAALYGVAQELLNSPGNAKLLAFQTSYQSQIVTLRSKIATIPSEGSE